MCANSVLIKQEEVDEMIVDKYNTELQKKRIEASMEEIVENLEKLYFI